MFSPPWLLTYGGATPLLAEVHSQTPHPASAAKKIDVNADEANSKKREISHTYKQLFCTLSFFAKHILESADYSFWVPTHVKPTSPTPIGRAEGLPISDH